MKNNITHQFTSRLNLQFYYAPILQINLGDNYRSAARLHAAQVLQLELFKGDLKLVRSTSVILTLQFEANNDLIAF